MMRDRITGDAIEDERYELAAGPAYTFAPSRREFVQTLGAGVVVSLWVRGASAQPPSRRRSGDSRGGGDAARPGQRIHIGADGVVTVLSGKVDVGQGSRTQICQAVAEELYLPMSQVRAVLGDTDLCPNDGGTSGSGTTPRTIPSVRAAAAAARQVLLDLAAVELKADATTLKIENGEVVDPNSKRRVTFAELAKGARLDVGFNQARAGDVKVEKVENWKVLGTSPPKALGEEILTGAHRYPSDIVRPNLLHGRILRPPAFGAKLTSIDPAAAETIKGAVLVRDGEFVGCAAPTSWLAAKAVDAIAATAKWDLPDPARQPTSDNLFQYLKEHARPGGGGFGGFRGGGNASRGAVEKGLASAKTILAVDFPIAYIQHAPMEPRAAVAEWMDGKLTVWTATQNPMRVRGELMQSFRLSTEHVRVIVPDSGGGFGGKHTGEVAIEAARLAKDAGRPVSVRWTREEEFTWAYFRPAGLIEVKAGIGNDGKLLAWDFTNYNSGGSAIETPYEIPNVRVRSISCDAPLRSGSYRALASTANTFARECMTDELAEAAGVDPLAFRLRHLPPGRLRDVLTAAANRFGWPNRSRQRAANCGVGLSCGTEKGSYTAACAEVIVDRANGTVKVVEVCQAFECGAIQNPGNLRAQVEGCILMGLGAALRERINFVQGKIKNARFSEYLVPRMDDLPKLDIVLIPRPDLSSAGAGETPIIAVAPAIANAVFQAAGVRVRSMPIAWESLKQA